VSNNVKKKEFLAIIRKIKPLIKLIIIIAIFTFIEPVLATSGNLSTLRGTLTERLDSIDVEKQIRKRQGLPLADLEAQSAAIKDSIAAIRDNMEKQAGPVQTEAKRIQAIMNMITQGANFYKRYIPHSTFDWIILSVAAAAAITCIFMLITFISLLLKKKKNVIKQKKANPAAKNTLYDRTGAYSKPDNPAVSDISGNSKKEIDILRKRILEERPSDIIGDVNAERKTEQTEIPDSKIVPGIKEEIIAASIKGADISELSKRFHIGTDQVSLILRMAQREYGNKHL
jgi:hypothetical protein